MRRIFFFSFLTLLCSSCIKTDRIDSGEPTKLKSRSIEAQIGSDLKYDPYNLSENPEIFLNTFNSSSPDGRKAIYRNINCLRSLRYNESGTVNLQICINRVGEVVYSKYLRHESSININLTVRDYIKCSASYKYQNDENAPEFECGKLNFRISNTTSKIRF